MVLLICKGKMYLTLYSREYDFTKSFVKSMNFLLTLYIYDLLYNVFDTLKYFIKRTVTLLIYDKIVNINHKYDGG